MAQAAAIAINNGASTPVEVTFSPEKVTPEVSVFADRSLGVSLGFPRLRLAFSPATSNRATNRSSFEVSMPVVADVDGVSVVAHTLRAKVDFILPDGCTDAQRKDLYAFVVNGLAHALVKGNLRDLDPLY